MHTRTSPRPFSVTTAAAVFNLPLLMAAMPLRSPRSRILLRQRKRPTRRSAERVLHRLCVNVAFACAGSAGGRGDVCVALVADWAGTVVAVRV